MFGRLRKKPSLFVFSRFGFMKMLKVSSENSIFKKLVATCRAGLSFEVVKARSRELRWQTCLPTLPRRTALVQRANTSGIHHFSFLPSFDLTQFFLTKAIFRGNLKFITLALSLFLFACSEETPKPLPELAKVEIPAELAGQYSGQLPCDNCKALIVRAIFSVDSNATIIRTLINDTLAVDTLHGVYSMTADSVVTVAAGEGIKWKFKRSSLGNLALLNGAGEIYKAEDGLKRELIRIFTVPKMRLVSDTAGTQKASE